MSSAAVAVVLAAGRSQRFGRQKALVELDGVPLLTRLVRCYSPSCEAVLVVTGFEAEPVARLAISAGARVVHNERYGDGVLTSIAAAQRVCHALLARCAHVLLSPVDLPLTDSAVPQALLEAARRAGTALTVPTFCGTYGYPLCLTKRAFGLFAGTITAQSAEDRAQVEVLRCQVADGGIRRLGLSGAEYDWLGELAVDDMDVVFNFNRPEHLDRWLYARRMRGDAPS